MAKSVTWPNSRPGHGCGLDLDTDMVSTAVLDDSAVVPWCQATPNITASERRANNFQRLENLNLKAKARIWP